MTGKRIPALTVYQPWASLIVAGLKRFEFRGWVPPRRFMNCLVAIHAGVKTESKERLRQMLDGYAGTAAIPIIEAAKLGRLPLGAVLGTAHITGTRLTDGLVEPLTGKKLSGGGFAWQMDKARAFPRPVPAKGSQGFWFWEYNTSARAAEQVIIFQGKPSAD